MFKNFKFSIRYKLLILLCFLTTFVLSLFLYVSTSLFKKDKMAYIFETSATLSRSLSSNIRNEIINITEKINIILGGYDDEYHVFNENSEAIFKRFPQLNTIAVYKRGDGSSSEKKVAHLYQEGKNFLLEEATIKKGLLLADSNGLYFAPLSLDSKSDQNLWILITPYQNGHILVVVDLDYLSKTVKSSISFQSFVIDEGGHTIIKSDNIDSLHISQFLNTSFFQTMKTSFFPEGTAQVSFPSGGQQLISYHRVGEGKLIVLTEISEDSAFESLIILSKKTILLFMALMAISLIISVVASRSLTSHLAFLTEAVGLVSEGRFDIQVDEGSRDEVGLLARGVNRMAFKISNLLSELERYSEQLEVMVEERTKELKEANRFIETMINSLGQGLLVFDKDGQCLPIFTKACFDIFGLSPENKKIWEIFLACGDKRDEEFLKKWVGNIFKNLIPFDDMVKLGPLYLTREGDLGPTYIDLNYKQMLDEEGRLSSVVLVATDKTEEQQAKRDSQKNQDHAQMVMKIVKNKEQFVHFISETKDLLKKISDSFQETKTLDCSALKLALHSIKGSFGVFSLSELQQMTHEVESFLDESTSKETSLSPELREDLSNKIQNLSVTFKIYLGEFSHFLGESVLDGIYRIEIKHDLLRDYGKRLVSIGQKNPLYIDFIQQFVRIPIVSFFKGHSDVIVDLAKRRGKKVAPILFHGGEIRIDKDFYGRFFTVIVHAFTNAVDHGIEFPEDRSAQGKPSYGQVIVSFLRQKIKEKDYLKIIIHDDGKGIDPQIIRQKLAKTVPVEKIETDDLDVIQHIFDESFSTAEQVSLTSGRGVGTAAIREVVLSMGGEIMVVSELHKGTKYVIILPYV